MIADRVGVYIDNVIATSDKLTKEVIDEAGNNYLTCQKPMQMLK